MHRSASKQRFFTTQNLLLLSIFVLRYQIDDEATKFRKHFEDDVKFCGECFRYQAENCENFFANLQSSDEFHMRNLLSLLPGVSREINMLKIRNTTKEIFAKYLSRDQQQKLNELRAAIAASPSIDKETFAQLYHKEQAAAGERGLLPNGLQLCPTTSAERFVNISKPIAGGNELTIWLYVMLNVQPLLMPLLSERQFPVPAHYATCGFSVFQGDAGQSLSSFYGSDDFRLKLRIAQQLLQAMLKFTDGVEGFRIYVTDLNADNVVYDEALDSLSLVDLDAVFVVDALAAEERRRSTSWHKHEYIDCMDCFAYSPQDICQHSKSDINIFAACQLLREDLKKNRSGGFLQPIPRKHSALSAQLDECVDCPDDICTNRLAPALALITTIEGILKT